MRDLFGTSRANVDVRIGDCLVEMRGLVAGSIDAVITDPPYSSGTRKEGAKGIRKAMTRGDSDATWFGSDCLTTNGFVWLLRECAIEWRRLLKPQGHVLVFIDWRMLSACTGAIESADLRYAGLIVWDKTYFGMGSCFRNQHELICHFTKGIAAPARRDVGNVIACKPIRNGVHPTEKPQPLIETLISVVSQVGDTILDPFAGSGTTGRAAISLGRRTILIESDPNYAVLARRSVGNA